MSPAFLCRRSRLLALFLAALLCLPSAFVAPLAGADEGDEANLAQAVNEKDGSSVFDLAFEVRRVSSGVVDQTNAAVAYANCESCQTVAIAVQIVLVSGTADTVAPTNVAIALNESCTSCQTLALAYQFVFGTGDVLEFTKEGRRMLRDIRKELRQLGKSGLTVDEIRAGAEELRLRIQELLATQLVPRGDRNDDDDDDDSDDDDSDDSEDDDSDDGGSDDDRPSDQRDLGGDEDDRPDDEDGSLDEDEQTVPEDDAPDDPREPIEQPPTETAPTEPAPDGGADTPATP